MKNKKALGSTIRNFSRLFHRTDLFQMVVGGLLDGSGRPICCEMWPGNYRLWGIRSLIRRV